MHGLRALQGRWGLARSIDVGSNLPFRGTTVIHCTCTDVRLVHTSNEAVFCSLYICATSAYQRLIGPTFFSPEGLGLVEFKARISKKLATTMTTGNVGRTFAQVCLDVIVTLIQLATRAVNTFPFGTLVTTLLIIWFEALSTKLALPKKSQYCGDRIVVFILVEKG